LYEHILWYNTLEIKQTKITIFFFFLVKILKTIICVLCKLHIVEVFVLWESIKIFKIVQVYKMCNYRRLQKGEKVKKR
jgi:hypothetical protein